MQFRSTYQEFDQQILSQTKINFEEDHSRKPLKINIQDEHSR